MLTLGQNVEVVALLQRDKEGDIRKDGLFNPVHCPPIMSELKKAGDSGCPILMGHNTYILAKNHFNARGEWRAFFPRSVIWSTSDTILHNAENSGDARNILVKDDAFEALYSAKAWAELFGKSNVFVIGGIDLFEVLMSKANLINVEVCYQDGNGLLVG